MTDWKTEWKRGMDLYRQAKHREAVEAYEAALVLAPERIEVMHSMAVALMHAGELDRAIAVGQRVVELDKNDPFAHTSLSIFYQRKGLIPEAEAEAAKARLKAWKIELKTNPKAPPPKDVGELDVIQ
jgi:tetratricopeptide (TPR) repeat protein